MRCLTALILAYTLVASPVWAGYGDLLPENPCGPEPLQKGPRSGSIIAILDVSGGGCAGPGAETVITCTVKEGDGVIAAPTEDVVVEFYSESDGASITGGPYCAAAGLPVGSTITMATGALSPPSPYSGAVVIPAPGGSCGPGCFSHGSGRVYSTGGVLHCTATRVDMSEVCSGGAPVPATTKELTLLTPHIMGTVGIGPHFVQLGD